MNIFQQGLLITGIGMGLVFGVIAFLWGLMALMLWATTRKRQEQEEGTTIIDTSESLVPEMQIPEGQRRAVAAAIAVQLAISADFNVLRQLDERNSSGGVSPWQIYHRAQQLENKRTRG